MKRLVQYRDIDLARIRDVYYLAMGFAIEKLNKHDKREGGYFFLNFYFIFFFLYKER